MLAHDEEWHATARVVAGVWLTSYRDVPRSVECQIVDCLTHSGSLETLAEIADVRRTEVFRDLEHMLAWLAIDALVRPQTLLADLTGIGAHIREFIWFLRDRSLS